MRIAPHHLLVIATLWAVPATVQTPAYGGSFAPGIGWQAELTTIAHDVSGTVTIVDATSVRVDDFTYDGGGPAVYFYLGSDDTRLAFEAGLSIGGQLTGTSFDGSQEPLLIEVPAGETLEGYHAISVWCADFNANFGSGTFLPVIPEPSTLALMTLATMMLSSLGRSGRPSEFRVLP